MIELEYYLLSIALMAAGGYYISYRYATEEYGKGFFDALMLHSSGQLTYNAYEEDGEQMLDINIKKDEE